MGALRFAASCGRACSLFGSAHDRKAVSSPERIRSTDNLWSRQATLQLFGVALTSLVLRRTLPRPTEIRNVFPQRRSQINLMILLVDKDLADQLGHREFAE